MPFFSLYSARSVSAFCFCVFSGAIYSFLVLILLFNMVLKSKVISFRFLGLGAFQEYCCYVFSKLLHMFSKLLLYLNLRSHYFEHSSYQFLSHVSERSNNHLDFLENLTEFPIYSSIKFCLQTNNKPSLIERQKS